MISPFGVDHGAISKLYEEYRDATPDEMREARVKPYTKKTKRHGFLWHKKKVTKTPRKVSAVKTDEWPKGSKPWVVPNYEQAYSGAKGKKVKQFSHIVGGEGNNPYPKKW